MIPAKRLRIIALRNDSKETNRLIQILQEHVLLTCAWSLPELLRLLQGDHYDLFLCAGEFQAGTWREAFDIIQTSHPRLPLVVFRPGSRNREWTCVIDAGRPEEVTVDIGESSLPVVLDRIAPGIIREAIVGS